MSEIKRKNALLRRHKTRVLWSEVQNCIGDTHFCRMFRMSRDCFSELCSKIIASIGESKFKSEAYIVGFLSPDAAVVDRSTIMHIAHTATSGGYLSGEVKLAITLCMLAGGSALDLAALFDVSSSHCQALFIDVLQSWIIKTNIGEIDVESYLDDVSAMRRVSVGFSKRSNGVLCGAIGAIDGWLV